MFAKLNGMTVKDYANPAYSLLFFIRNKLSAFGRDVSKYCAKSSLTFFSNFSQIFLKCFLKFLKFPTTTTPAQMRQL